MSSAMRAGWKQDAERHLSTHEEAAFRAARNLLGDFDPNATIFTMKEFLGFLQTDFADSYIRMLDAYDRRRFHFYDRYVVVDDNGCEVRSLSTGKEIVDVLNEWGFLDDMQSGRINAMEYGLAGIPSKAASKSRKAPAKRKATATRKPATKRRTTKGARR